MPEVETIELEEGIFQVLMNRPEKRNALSSSQIGRLIDAFRALNDNRACRVIILSGAGEGFCAGADLTSAELCPAAENRSRVGMIYKSQEQLVAMLLSIYENEKPVIAAIHGAAVGGGLSLALASDIRVGSSTAKLGAAYMKAGFSNCDVGSSYLLPRIVGQAAATELLLTARTIGADECLRLGLLSRVVPQELLLDTALEIAREIRANNEYGVWMTKKGLQANMDAPSLRHATELENRQQVLASFTGNMEEAFTAFAEKRPPDWQPL